DLTDLGRECFHHTLVNRQLNVTAQRAGNLPVVYEWLPVCYHSRVGLGFGFSVKPKRSDESHGQVETRNCSGWIEQRTARAEHALRREVPVAQRRPVSGYRFRKRQQVCGHVSELRRRTERLTQRHVQSQHPREVVSSHVRVGMKAAIRKDVHLAKREHTGDL